MSDNIIGFKSKQKSEEDLMLEDIKQANEWLIMFPQAQQLLLFQQPYIPNTPAWTAFIEKFILLTYGEVLNIFDVEGTRRENIHDYQGWLKTYSTLSRDLLNWVNEGAIGTRYNLTSRFEPRQYIQAQFTKHVDGVIYLTNVYDNNGCLGSLALTSFCDMMGTTPLEVITEALS